MRFISNRPKILKIFGKSNTYQTETELYTTIELSINRLNMMFSRLYEEAATVYSIIEQKHVTVMKNATQIMEWRLIFIITLFYGLADALLKNMHKLIREKLKHSIGFDMIDTYLFAANWFFVYLLVLF